MQRIPEIDAFFSKQKPSETLKFEVDEQSENRPSRSYTVIDFVEQSESRPLALISSAKKTDYSCFRVWNLILIMYTYIKFN